MTLLAIGGPVVLTAAVFALGWHLIDNNLRCPRPSLRPVLEFVTEAAGRHRSDPQRQYVRRGWERLRATWAARAKRPPAAPPAVSEEDLHWEDDTPQQPGGEQPEGHDGPGPLFSEWNRLTDSGILRAIEARP